MTPDPKPDISFLAKAGHFYFAPTPAPARAERRERQERVTFVRYQQIESLQYGTNMALINDITLDGRSIF